MRKMGRGFARYHGDMLPHERGPSLFAGMIVIGLLGIASLTIDQISSPQYAYNPRAQVAGITAASVGACEKTYQNCMSKAKKQSDKQECELKWNNCVVNKCTIDPESQGIKQCPKDADCESSCTESATGKKGLLACCENGPKHNNSCRKRIDDKCRAAGSTADKADKLPPTDPNQIARLHDQREIAEGRIDDLEAKAKDDLYGGGPPLTPEEEQQVKDLKQDLKNYNDQIK